MRVPGRLLRLLSSVVVLSLLGALGLAQEAPPSPARDLDEGRFFPVTETWIPFEDPAARVLLGTEGTVRVDTGSSGPLPLFDLEELKEFLASMGSRQPVSQIRFEAFSKLKYSRVEEVLRVLRDAGIEKVGVRTFRPGTSPEESLEEVGGLWLPLGLDAEATEASADAREGVLHVESPSLTGAQPGGTRTLRAGPDDTWRDFVETLDLLLGAGRPDEPGYRLVFSRVPGPETSAGGPAEEVPEPVEVGGSIQPPKPIYEPAPDYTEIARRTRIQGTVVIRAVIDEKGLVAGTQVLRGLPMGLTQKALDAVQTWQFEPATLDGQPVPVYFELSVDFELQ